MTIDPGGGDAGGTPGTGAGGIPPYTGGIGGQGLRIPNSVRAPGPGAHTSAYKPPPLPQMQPTQLAPTDIGGTVKYTGPSPVYTGPGAYPGPVKPPPVVTPPSSSLRVPNSVLAGRPRAYNPRAPVGGVMPTNPYDFEMQNGATMSQDTAQLNQGRLVYPGESQGPYSPSGAQTSFPAGDYNRFRANAFTPSLLTGNQAIGGITDYNPQFNILNPASWQLPNLAFDTPSLSFGGRPAAGAQASPQTFQQAWDAATHPWSPIPNEPWTGYYPNSQPGREPGAPHPMPQKTPATGGGGGIAGPADTGPASYGGYGGGGGGGGNNQPPPWFYGLTTWRF